MSIDRGIELLKDWIETTKPIYKTNISSNANSMAKTLPLFQKFVESHPDFWKSEFGYIPNGKAGQKSAHYVTFTDMMLRPALEQITGEAVTFDYKRAGGRADSSAAVRAIRGWQQPCQIKIPNPNREDERLPIDDEMCDFGDSDGGGPDYDV